MATSYGQTNAIKAAIIGLFTTEMQTGKLPSVLAVGPVAYPEAGVYPYIGVELIHRKEEVIANNNRASKCLWGINISVRSTTLMQDAVALRDVIIDDGAGNGVEPLLRNVARTRFSGLISKGEIKEVFMTNNLDANKTDTPTEFFSEAAIFFETLQVITA